MSSVRVDMDALGSTQRFITLLQWVHGPITIQPNLGVDRALWLDATFFENPECTHEGHLFIDFTMATPASPKSIAVECQGHFG